MIIDVLSQQKELKVKALQETYFFVFLCPPAHFDRIMEVMFYTCILLKTNSEFLTRQHTTSLAVSNWKLQDELHNIFRIRKCSNCTSIFNVTPYLLITIIKEVFSILCRMRSFVFKGDRLTK